MYQLSSTLIDDFSTYVKLCTPVHSNSPKIILIRFTPENRFALIRCDS